MTAYSAPYPSPLLPTLVPDNHSVKETDHVTASQITRVYSH